MRSRCLLLAAVLLVGCGHGSKPETSYPTLERSAELVSIPNAVLFDGMLIGGTPSRENLEQARDLGYKTIINLRTRTGVDEERQMVEELGMTFVHLPVHLPDGLSGETARALVEILDQHEGFFLIHCKTGERAAALMALRAACVEGKDEEEAVVVGRRLGLKKLETMVREALPARCLAQAPVSDEG